MDGCKSVEPEIIYFDNIYTAAMQLVDLDNLLQQTIEYHLVVEDDIDSYFDDYSNDTSEIKSKFEDIKVYIKSQVAALDTINIFDNKFDIKDAYSKLLSAYNDNLIGVIPNIINLIDKDLQNEKAYELLNSIYPNMQTDLDRALDEFYKTIFEYAAKYNIDIK